MFQRFPTLLLAALILTSNLAWAKPQPDAYVQTAQLVQEYDKAVERGELQQALKAQEAALKSWYALEPQQKRRLEVEFGAMYAWLQGGQDYTGDNTRPAIRRRR